MYNNNNNIQNNLLRDFFSNNFNKTKIFNHTEGNNKTPPLFGLINQEKFLNFKEKFKSRGKQFSLYASVFALGLSISHINIEENFISDTISDISHILNIKQSENELPEVVVFDFDSQIFTIKNEKNNIILDDLNELTDNDIIELNWDFKTPSNKFKHYYTSTYNNSIPSQMEFNEIEDYYGIPKNAIYYMAFKESKFNLSASSHKQAKGLLGFLKSTAKEFNLITSKNDFIKQKNGYATVDTAARYLLWLNSHVNGFNQNINDPHIDNNGYTNLDYTLAAYNAGPSNVIVYAKNQHGKKEPVINQDGSKKTKIPNYTETKNYIKDINMLMKEEGYIVQKNDTIGKISKKFGIHESVIIRNNLDVSNDQSLKYGQVINIVNNPEEEIKIVIEKGFSISKIARQTGYNVEGLLSYNNLNKKSLLLIGDVISLPPLNATNLIKNKNKKSI